MSSSSVSDTANSMYVLIIVTGLAMDASIGVETE